MRRISRPGRNVEEHPYSDKRVDRFQRFLITFFYREQLSPTERQIVIWTVRIASSALVIVVSMVVTLLTEKIENFLWTVYVFVALYVAARIFGAIRRKMRRNRPQ